MRVAYEIFRSTWSSWQELFGQAAQFATGVGPQRLISISHSEENGHGVVTVWYWADARSAAAAEDEALGIHGPDPSDIAGGEGDEGEQRR